MAQIVVLATLTARAGSEDALAGVLSGMVPPTRLEEGCVRYDLLRDPANRAILVFQETWASREAHQAHMKTPHFLAARSQQEGLVASREVKVLEQLC